MTSNEWYNRLRNFMSLQKLIYKIKIIPSYIL